MNNLKILISNDGLHAHFYERVGLLKAFNSVPGITAKMYECKKYSPFDIFGTFEPDIFIGQLYNIDRATLKCILNRPHLKVALKAGDWGDFQTTYDNSKYNILYSTENDLNVAHHLKTQMDQPSFVFTYYLQEDLEKTHNYFPERLGIDVVSIPLAADTFTYAYGTRFDDLACDVSFVGGWWPHKGINLDPYLRRLCYPIGKFNVKIFSRAPWPNLPQYSGQINDDMVKHLFASSTICPNISEPHSTDLGVDINERAFKIMAAGGFCIYDNVRAAKTIFKPGIHAIYAESPEEFEHLVNYYLNFKNNDERISIAEKGQKLVLDKHTYFDRASLILSRFGFDVVDLFNTAKQELINDKINNFQ